MRRHHKKKARVGKIVFIMMVISLPTLTACGNGNPERSSAGRAGKPGRASLPAPSGLSTLSGDRQVTIRWDAVGGASAYNIYFSPQTGVEKEKAARIEGIKTTSYEHKGLANGVVHYYRIAAVNEAGEGLASPETGAMPKATPPAQPSGVAATGGTGKILVKWDPAPGAAYYNVYYSARPQVEKSKRTKIPDIKGASYECADVKKKTMYFFVVSAVNEGGESPVSAESGAMP